MRSYRTSQPCAWRSLTASFTPSSNCGWAIASSPLVVKPPTKYSVFFPAAPVVDVCAPAGPDAIAAATMAVAMHAITTFLSFLKAVHPLLCSRVRSRRVIMVLSRATPRRGVTPSGRAALVVPLEGDLLGAERRLLTEVGRNEGFPVGQIARGALEHELPA